MPKLFPHCVLVMATLLPQFSVQAEPPAAPPRPNIIVILTDDLGYGDLSVNGCPVIQTPRIDEMAAQGMRFTNFYMAAAQCTPSRAALLTGSYAQRIGLEGVVFSTSDYGLNPSETTLPELLHAQGYATALFGKWHLGHQKEVLPLRHGFDEFFGLPYSNDMDPKVILRGDEVVEEDFEQATLTQRFTDETIRFIDEQKGPFFVLLAQPMPHKPLAATEKFLGTSEYGLYGDVVSELDHHVGRLLDHLRERGLAENTLVLFTSDNGPWQPRARPDPDVGGFAAPFRGYKTTNYEGGLRVPLIAWWPGTIRPGSINGELATALDLLPTLTLLAGGTVPDEPTIDGVDARPLFLEADAKSPRDLFFYYHYDRLDGVRDSRYKLLFARQPKWDHHFYYQEEPEAALAEHGPATDFSIPEALYDLSTDPMEQHNVIADHPEVVAKLREAAEKIRTDLGDERTGQTGAGKRPALIIDPTPGVVSEARSLGFQPGNQ